MTVRRQLAPDDRRHGTSNGYINYKCRCSLCRQANYDKGVACDAPMGLCR